jgi:protoporphyrinogen oxidase
VNTLPLSMTLGLLDPAPPDELLEIARTIRYRHMVLLVIALRRKRFTPNASLYFPDASIPFTRIFEPKNRSADLAPADQTAIVVEIPCNIGDRYWTASADGLVEEVAAILQRTGLLRRDEIIMHRTSHVPFAYPVLEVGYERKVAELIAWLTRFEGLHLTGRSALFQYSHIHDLFRMGKEMVGRIVEV